MHQVQFASNAATILQQDDDILGVAVGGSWLTAELDQYSDLDLIVVTKNKITDDKANMISYAKRIGHFISGFTGEHVGEPRVLICLFDDPLLHVDIKFVTAEEFGQRVEDPVILFDRFNTLKQVLENTSHAFPYPDYQWIEDRFWTWVHYALLKIGRGEFMEAYDFFGFLRMLVFGPLLHIKNGNLPRGVRKVETSIPGEDFDALIQTVPSFNRPSMLGALKNAIELYRQLRISLFDEQVQRQALAEKRVMEYFDLIEAKP